MTSTKNRSNVPFTSTGNMWGAVYDGIYAGEALDEAIKAEIQLAYGDKQSKILKSAKSKSILILFQYSSLKGLLNTNAVARSNPKTGGLEIMSAFPEVSTMPTSPAYLKAVTEYSSGFEARLTLQLIPNPEYDYDPKIIEVFDTHYIENCDKYEIGRLYEFHLGALITSITHRESGMLRLKMSKKAQRNLEKATGKTQKTMSTSDLFALDPQADDNPELFSAYTKFGGLHSPAFHHPLLPKTCEIYHFEIRRQLLGEDYDITIPAIFTDGVMAESHRADKGNRRRKKSFAPGDPIDLTGVLTAYLAK